MLKITSLLSRKDNYIWLIRSETGPEAVVVDPGEAGPVEHALRKRRLTLVAILVTHHHYDHVEGITELITRYQVPVFGPANEPIPCLTQPVGEGEHITLKGVGMEFSVMEIPGHTTGHVGYYGHGTFFCGDTLFAAGCGKVFDGTPEQLFRSLQRISRLPEETLVYCAHEYTEENLQFALTVEPGNPALGERLEKIRQLRAAGLPTLPVTLAEEKQTNPFLRCHEPEVIRAVEQFTGRPLVSTEEVFVALRRWRDRI